VYSTFQVPAFSALYKILIVTQRSKESYYKIIPTIAKLLLAYLFINSGVLLYVQCQGKLVYDLQSIFSSLNNWVSVKEKTNKNKNEILYGLEALAEPISGNRIKYVYVTWTKYNTSSCKL